MSSVRANPTRHPGRLTAVQKDVLDRMKAGWKLDHPPLFGPFMLQKHGEPSRHVYALTVLSLRDRGLIRKDDGHWVLA